MSARILTCSDAEYYADPCSAPSLSASIAKELISCPSKAWLHHPRLGGKSKEATDAMRKGSLVDEIITSGSERIRVIESAKPSKGEPVVPENYLLADTKNQRDEILGAGLLPCLPHELESANAKAQAILSKAKKMGFPLTGERQVAVEWTEVADDGTEVLCRCKMDLFRPDVGLVQDIKVTNDASPDGCRRAFRSFNYDLQGAAYLSAVVALMPWMQGRERFQLVCAEDSEPYPVTFVGFRGSRLELGRAKWRRAINTWARCLRTNEWPDYATGEISIEADPWDFEREYAA